MRSLLPASASLAVFDAPDFEIHSRGLKSKVQVTTGGCMGLCGEGPIMVVYPEGSWYRRVQSSDFAEIVDRLLWRDASAMKAMSIDHGETFRAAVAARDSREHLSFDNSAGGQPWVKLGENFWR